MQAIKPSELVVYQFYSLCYNCREIRNWIPFLKQQGYNAVYFTPIFKSTNHGYDTEDFKIIDPRFGTNEELRALVDELHENGIAVIIDGVFNHVGRNFWAFQDVLSHEGSHYEDWFLAGDSEKYFPEERFHYQGWEGNYDLVLLNHNSPKLEDYLMAVIQFWQDEFAIDGIRLDVAYSLPDNFLERLRKEYSGLLIGEQIHGDYNRLLNAGLDLVTDYNLFKALWSSVVDKNLFELNWTLEQHQQEYPQKQLLTFLDNHDTDRISSRFTSSQKVLDE